MGNAKVKLCAILAALFTFAAVGSANALDKITLRLDFSAAGYHAPFYYGVAKGFYRDQGIDLQILEGKGSANSITLVGTGANDFAFADTTTAARLIAQGLPVKVVMGILQKPTLSIFFPANAGIKTPGDLKGKRIAMCPSDGMAQYVPAYLEAVNLKRSDVQFVNVDCSAKYATVAQGRADAVATYITGGKHNMASVGINDSDFFSFSDAGISLPGHGIIASNNTIEQRPDLVKRFNAATAKAWIEAKKHPDDAVAAFKEANPLKNDPAPVVRDDLMISLGYVVPHAGKPFGWQPPEQWEAVKTLLTEFAGMPATAQSKSFFTNDFLSR